MKKDRINIRKVNNPSPPRIIKIKIMNCPKKLKVRYVASYTDKPVSENAEADVNKESMNVTSLNASVCEIGNHKNIAPMKRITTYSAKIFLIGVEKNLFNF